MYARVVRFTDVDPDHLAGRIGEVEASEGPPVDIPAKSVQILHDPDQRTAVVIQLFETADDMSAAEGPRRDGPGGDARDARLDRPLRDQGGGGSGVRQRRLATRGSGCQSGANESNEEPLLYCPSSNS